MVSPDKAKTKCSVVVKLYKLQFTNCTNFKNINSTNYKDRPTGSFKNKERCGRPRITMPKQERIAHHLSSSDRKLTAIDNKKHIECYLL